MGHIHAFANPDSDHLALGSSRLSRSPPLVHLVKIYPRTPFIFVYSRRQKVARLGVLRTLLRTYGT